MTSGVGVASRWPVVRQETRGLPGDSGNAAGSALFAAIEGPRGLIQLFVVMLDYALDASARRQAQVRQLCQFVSEVTSRRLVTIVCGDFNAGPDADDIRMLTGRSAPPVPGLVFYDAWEIAGDGTAGILVEPEPARRGRALPGPPLRLHPVSVASGGRRRTARALPFARGSAGRNSPPDL